MGFRCDRCGYEWISRSGANSEPRVCPGCHSPYWNTPSKRMMTYENFRTKIRTVLRKGVPLTWTEIRTEASLPQLFPNNQWVHRLEKDIGLNRQRDTNGIIKWHLGDLRSQSDATAKVTDPPRARSRRR